MAEVIVGPLLNKLQEVAVKEAEALVAVSGEINKLRDKLMWLQALVYETDLRGRVDSSRHVRVLAFQMREVGFEAEDAIDLFYLTCRRFGRRNWRRAAVDLIVNFRTHLVVRWTLSPRIRSLNARLEAILDNSTKYGSSSSKDNDVEPWRARHAIPPIRLDWDMDYTEPFKFCGRFTGEQRMKILTETKDEDSPIPEVIPVFGHGGAGKRAFLKYACEAETIDLENRTIDLENRTIDLKKHFDVRIPVRFPPDVDDESVMAEKVKETLEKELYNPQKAPTGGDNVLQQVCYLVVIERPINTTTWSKLKPLLQKLGGKEGSKILLPVISTPNKKGDKKLEADSTIKLIDLTEAHCVTLFNHIYGLNGRRGTDYKTMQMNWIRGSISDITGGHPLAVVLLAKFMRTVDLSKWEAAAKYLVSCTQDSKLETLLSVCVDDLHDELKSCLLFTAGFPEGRDMDAKQLVRLWMAEGFLTQHSGLDMERLGQCYLKELIYRGLLQLVSKTSGAHGDGLVERVAIHDQIHPLLKSEAQRTSVMDVHYGGGCFPAVANTRRLAVHDMHNHDVDALLSSGLDKLRTVVSFSADPPNEGTDARQVAREPPNSSLFRGLCLRARQVSRQLLTNSSFFHGLCPRATCLASLNEGSKPERKMSKLLKGSPYLRVIDMEGVDVFGGKLPDCIGEMVQLQYLGVRGSQKLENLPPSVGNLRRLQTIDVRNTQVRELPERVWKIKTLRHVLGDRLAFPVSTTGNDLKLLQTLETMTIKKYVSLTTTKSGKEKESRPALPSLQRLHVEELEGSQEEALRTVLNDLGSLHSLSLSGEAIPINSLIAREPASCLGQVVSLELVGELMPHDASYNDGIFNRLTRLVLRSTKIKQDFINDVISKLPALDELVLHEDSYEDKELDLCAHRFRRLTVLEVSGLRTLEKVSVPSTQVKVSKPYHVKLETGGHQDGEATPGPGDGGGSNTTTDADANQSPLPSAPVPAGVGQKQASSPSPDDNVENAGQQQDGQATHGDGGGSNTTTTAYQSPPPSIPEMILEAIGNKELSLKEIKKAIKHQCEAKLDDYLGQMVQSGKLHEIPVAPPPKKYSQRKLPTEPQQDKQ